MIIKLQTLKDSQESLKKLAKVVLPAKIGYRINKVLNKVNSEVRSFEDQRFALIKRLGKQTNAESDTWQLLPENNEAFNKEMKELGEIEVDIDFEKLKIEDLGEIHVAPEILVEWVFN